MKIIDLQQGSPEWLEHRSKHFNASDAPAMKNDSPYVKRNELIHALKTGDTKDFSEFEKKYILEKGHRFEALARPLAETILDEDLSPQVGVNGKFSASFDGLNFSRTKGFEHKTLNKAIRAASTVEELPIYYREQMESQLAVGDGETESILFMATLWEKVAPDYDGDEPTGWAEDEKGELCRYKLVEEKHFMYYPDLELRQALIDGWEQLEKDVAAYEPPIIEAAPVAAEIADLPSVVVTDNAFPDKATRTSYTKQAIALLTPTKTIPANQQEAGDLLVRVEKVTDAEKTFKKLIEQTNVSEAERDEFRKWLADMQKLFSKGRIDGGKGIDAFKQNQKTEMVNAATNALLGYIDTLNAALPKQIMPEISADFWAAIKGKSNPDNIKNDLDALVADKKIEADKVFATIRANLEIFSTLAVGHESLFDTDLQELCQKDADSFRAVVMMRIIDHQEATAKQACTEPPTHSVVVLVDPASPGAAASVNVEAGEIIHVSTKPASPDPDPAWKISGLVAQMDDGERVRVLQFCERVIEQRKAAA